MEFRTNEQEEIYRVQDLNLMPKTTYKQAIRLKCFDCGYDEQSVGTFLQQIAACPCATSCPLHEHRPLPRHCRKDGEIVEDALNAVIARLHEIEERARERDRASGS